MSGRYGRSVCLSIVSHGQGRLISPLLSDLLKLRERIAEVIVTLNIPEDEVFLAEFFDRLPLRVLRNVVPLGFGANHNGAFAVSSAPFFVVVNPDIRLSDFALDALLQAASEPGNGVAAPIVYDSKGRLQDSARRFPTVGRLVRRKLGGGKVPDYILGRDPLLVDWVAGMFMVFRREVYASVDGFDDRYFMYFEDVDLCHRLHRAGLRVALLPQVRVVHDAQRTSRRKLKYLVWHLSSACRYFLTD
jgi:N-acetylglucosaminyl-diphospho-decaprenol L-rhamnosyltransferase